VRFASRQEAGQELGRHLRNAGTDVDLVVGLPRGGVVVAAEVARILQRPLAALVVRKIGHPSHREFAVGALAEGDVMLVDETMAADAHLHAALERVIAEEKIRLREYQKKFHRDQQTDFHGQRILLVDDGLATGATARAALLSARRLGARKVFLAVPVAAASTLEQLTAVADGATALVADSDLVAVGQYYNNFDATTDAEVVALLHGADKSK